MSSEYSWMRLQKNKDAYLDFIWSKSWRKFAKILKLSSSFFSSSSIVQEKQWWQPRENKKERKKQFPHLAIAGIMMLGSTSVWHYDPISEAPELMKFFSLKWGSVGPKKTTLRIDLDHRFADVGKSLQQKQLKTGPCIQTKFVCKSLWSFSSLSSPRFVTE